MTAEERARALREAMDAELRTINGDIGWTILITAAIRAAENDTLQRAADAIGGLVKPCADYCEHAYCVAVYDARSTVLALKSKPPEGK